VRPTALALVRGRDAITAVLWCAADAPRALRVACRRDGTWGAAATAADLPAPTRAIEAVRIADGRIAAVVAHDAGISVLISDDGERWSHVVTAGAVDNVALAGATLGRAAASAEGIAVPIARDGRARLLHLDVARGTARLGDDLPSGAPGMLLGDGTVLHPGPASLARHESQRGAWREQAAAPALALVDAGLRGDGTIAGLARTANGFEAVLLSPGLMAARTMTLGNAAAGAPARVIASPVGMAVCVVTANGLRFVEFPPERMAPVGGATPTEKELAGRPYHEHMHLVEP
jgi:hypothetical protein